MNRRGLGAGSVVVLFAVIFLSSELVAAAPFVRGEVNQDGRVDISDPVCVLLYLFLEERTPACLDAADVDDSGTIDITDAVRTFGYLFAGGPMPVAPYPTCGPDVTDDELSCVSFDPGRCPGSGYVTDVYGCKTYSKDVRGGSPDQECIAYQYDGSSTLELKHINAGFNCCPLIHVAVAVEDTIITINETETFGPYGGCFCLCLFDLDMEVLDIEPGAYVIKVNNPYVKQDDEPLVFSVDLPSSPSGSYCVRRDHYPWIPGE
jgi:hypothetical protein